MAVQAGAGFTPIHHFTDLQPEPPATLLGQGFVPPDFSTGGIRALLARLVKQTDSMQKAASFGEQALVAAGAAAEQAARHADRAFRLPAAEPGTEAMGEFEGFLPPRWWITYGRKAMGSCHVLLPLACVHESAPLRLGSSRSRRRDTRQVGGFL
ncbi:unnamed protein product [Symbiodinium natans]|uniref:Uncharacterized protein n=1 Tax=Symbiodinium natans TaxID=878477 RepID=A0A812T734_9DINO|nr:unnamed protein product [Symbiodinium natans]